MTKILLQGGNVLDPAHGSLLLRHDVLIENDRIVDVSATPIDAPNASDMQRIDVTGKTVMPGLIDCHVHVLASLANLGANALQPGSLTSIRALPIVEAMLNRGFTTVRDAGGADWGLAQAIAIGLVPGPRIFPSGKALSQTGGHGDFRPRSDVLEPCSCAFRAGLHLNPHLRMTWERQRDKVSPLLRTCQNVNPLQSLVVLRISIR